MKRKVVKCFLKRVGRWNNVPAIHSFLLPSEFSHGNYVLVTVAHLNKEEWIKLRDRRS